MQVLQSKISKRNQTVVPSKIRKLLNLRQGERIVWKVVLVRGAPKVLIDKLPKDIVSYARGLGKELWEDVNIEDYVKSLRKEWDKKEFF